jgi:surface polysaccharide O-acyltransferase-like enzyme
MDFNRDSEPSVKTRLIWTDILKILAIFGVILLHVSAPYLVPFENSREWWIGNIYDSLTRWSVPLFIMVSGALILPEAENIPFRQFLLGRFRRILIPFLSWSGIYFFYRLEVKGNELALGDFFRLLLTEPIYYHLWFIYMLLVLYLFAPAASAFLNEASRRHAWYLLALWFFWASILPVIEKLLAVETYFSPDMNDYSPLRLSGYFLLGYLLREWHAGSAPQFALALLLFLAGGAATIFGTYYASGSRGEFDPFFYNYFSVTVAAMAVSLFVLVKSSFVPKGHKFRLSSQAARPGNGNEDELNRFNHTPLRQIGMSIFGVYLAHALVLELLRDGRLGFTIDHTSAFGIAIPLAAGLPLFALSIFGLSLAAVLVIRFIPITRELLT